MYIISLAPICAYFLDYLMRRFGAPTKFVFVFIGLLWIPPSLVWLSGYEFSDRQVHWSAILLIVSGLFLLLYSFVHQIPLKAAISALSTLFISAILFIAAFAEGYTGNRTSIATANFKNYRAKQYGPKAYSDEKSVIIIKTKLNGWLERVVTDYYYVDTMHLNDCRIYVSDGRIELVYDICENQLSTRK